MSIRHFNLKVRGKSCTTPLFMPVATQASFKSMDLSTVQNIGFPVVLCNTYHLFLSPGTSVIKEANGLHNFTNYNGLILTDSGGFQVFSLANMNQVSEEGVYFKDPKSGTTHFISPEISIQTQFDLGADIIMAFDQLIGLKEHDHDRQTEASDRTNRWLLRSLNKFKELTKDIAPDQRPLFFGINQGGLDLDLRLKNLKFIQSIDVDGIAIGGLSVGESREDMFKVISFLEPYLDPQRPHYLMGVGHPIDLDFAYRHGVDMADCVLPTRNARHGQAWCKDPEHGFKAINITNARYKNDFTVLDNCPCKLCQNFSKAYLHHLFKNKDSLGGQLLSIHNLTFLYQMIQKML